MYLESIVFSKAIMYFLLPAILGVLCSVLGFTFKKAIVTTGNGNCGSHKHGRLHLQFFWILYYFSRRMIERARERKRKRERISKS